jgi:hypothetical protein
MRTKNILNYSLKDISSLLNVDKTKAKAIQWLVNGKMDPELIHGVSEWITACFNRPREHELVLDALNRLTGGCGIEAMEIEGRFIDSYFREVNFLYVNNGQSYDNTIMFDCDTWKYFIGTTGDVTEYLDRNP